MLGSRVLMVVWVLLLSLRAARADKIDDCIKTQMLWQQIPGLSVAVIKDGKLIKAKGYGKANVELSIPATPQSVYKIASVSKQFIAAGILVLVQDGKLSLDAPLSQYMEGTPETWKAITIRHLLTHTSGLEREAPGFDPYKIQTDAQVIQSAYSVPLRSAPGEKWSYSNTGYFCLAEVIHRVSGTPWSTFLQERVFRPAGMTATQTITSAIVPQRASGYETDGTLQNAENWLALRPSGAFLSTVQDVAHWEAALVAQSILSADSLAQAWTPVTLASGKTHPYGFGWFIDTVQGHKRVSHSGGVPGFVCEYQRYVDDGLSVVLMANVGSRDLGPLAVQLAALSLPSLAPKPTETAREDRAPEITRQVTRIFAGLAQSKVEATLFTPTLSTRLTSDAKSGLADILRRLGSHAPLRLIEHQQKNAEHLYRYLVSYTYLELFIEVTYNKEKKITQFGVHD